VLHQNLTVMDYDYNPLTTGQIIAISLCSLAISIFLIAAQWKVYVKAGKPGWRASFQFTTYMYCFKFAVNHGGGYC
jgi:hypothetical protein